MLFEELELKKRLSKKLGIQLNQSGLKNVVLHTNKFDNGLMPQLRLSFLTSKILMDIDSTAAVETNDFKSLVEPNMERMIYDFLIESLESHSNNLKSKDHY